MGLAVVSVLVFSCIQPAQLGAVRLELGIAVLWIAVQKVQCV